MNQSYPSGEIQHAGVVIGLGGVAGHSHRWFPDNHPGYMGRLGCTQWVSAVTAACLVVSRHKFEEVGGFDEIAFPVTLNDVDFCLKLLALGYHNVWTPRARLTHKESATRPSDYALSNRGRYAAEVLAFKDRWRDMIKRDPHYNRNLTLRDESFDLK